MYKSTATHTALDSWTPPTGISVTAIAGWGQDTVKTLAYITGSKVICTNYLTYSVCADSPQLQHAPVLTQDGDDTVVSPSAIGVTGSSLYFDTLLFEKGGNGKIVHQNLTSGTPIQKVIANLLMNKNPTTEQYIVTDKPTGGKNPITLRVSSHSPVRMIVTDVNGSQSGILPIPGTDFSGMKKDIPNSSVQVFDDEEYINVPQSSTYRIIASGYAVGSATLNVDTVGSDGVVTASTTFANIPTSASSTATLLVTGGVPTAPVVDVNGDGVVDFTAASSSPTTDPLVYVRYMRMVVKTLTLSRETAREIDERLSDIEHQLIPDKKESGDKGKKEKKDKDEKERQYILIQQRGQLALKLDILTRYVEQRVELAQRESHKRDSQQGISAASAEIILGMINQLKALL